MHLLVALAGHGLGVLRRELSVEMPGEKGALVVPLGGVACQFKREIGPGERFEVWTRVLAWDRKWIYVVGFFVRPGTVGRRGRGVLREGKGGEKEGIGKGYGEGEEERPVVYASAIAKYVLKKGRVTIPPERLLRASMLLPEKPEGWETPKSSQVEVPNAGGTELGGVATAAVDVGERLGGGGVDALLEEAMQPREQGEGEWTWQRVEEERQRGMKIAAMYAGLEALNEEAPVHGQEVLGEW